MLRELNFIPQNVGESSIAVLPLERCCPVQHLEDQDTQSPPVHGASVTTALDNLGRNVLFRPNK